jgi:transcriptional repressor NrdR
VVFFVSTREIMKCPFCAHPDTEVLESRAVDAGSGVRRRRQCPKCKKRFTTVEKIRQAVLWVVKKDGRRELFDPEKIKKGILRAVEKRAVPLAAVEKIVAEVEQEMLRQEKEEVLTKAIGQAVLARLKKIDKVAWLRFASVYFEFANLTDFEKVLEKK